MGDIPLYLSRSIRGGDIEEGESILRGWEHRPLPTSTREPSAHLLAKEEARLAAILRRHEALLSQHPAMLPLPAKSHF